MTGAIDIAQRKVVKPSRAWLRALETTAPIAQHPHRVLLDVIEEVSDRFGDSPALLSDRESFSYRQLVARSNQYSRWALDEGIRKGDVVGLLMPNRPEYFALWLGITAVGAIVALLNTNLSGASLAHSINVVQPKRLVVDAELSDSLASALPAVTCEPAFWIHGADHAAYSRIDDLVQRLPSESTAGGRPQCSVDDVALHIYTSGTTGMPKAANVSHSKILQWCHWFAGMIDIQPDDRTYNCLPMYHSIGGVAVPGAALVAGGSVVVRESFSASRFWNDLVRWDCTIFQYIGEFCRYLLHAPACDSERNHRIRLACGNGMSLEVWREFQNRFNIPQILEFYASTEGGISLFNVEGEPGAIGRVPAYLAHRFSPVLVKFDAEVQEPLRNEHGFCIPCAVNEPGEALVRVLDAPSQAGSRFEGYTDRSATEKKLLRDVFEPGDIFVRTGDLMRKNEKGFFYFVDRAGDTFRWKGENVATTEVAQAISAFPAIQHAIVYGVKVAGAEGRVGMAAITCNDDLDLSELRRHLVRSLPAYARPAFIRLQDRLEITGTFKYSKTELISQGYNPAHTSDAIYFDNPESQAFEPLDHTLFDRIQSGQIRL